MKKGLIYGSTMAILAIGLFVGSSNAQADITIRNSNENTNTIRNTNNITNNASASATATGGNASIINGGCGCDDCGNCGGSGGSGGSSVTATGGTGSASGQSSSSVNQDQNTRTHSDSNTKVSRGNGHNYKADKHGKKLPATGSDMLILAGLAMFAGLVVFLGTRSAVKAK